MSSGLDMVEKVRVPIAWEELENNALFDSEAVATSGPESPSASRFVAAGAAAACSSGLFNPLDGLRVRWQVQGSNGERHRRLYQLASHIIREEGGLWRGLWRPGLAANMTGMAASAALRFGYYEQVRDAIVRSTSSDSKQAWSMLGAGLICGSTAYFATTPFHFLKTKMQGDAANRQTYVEAISKIIQEDGVIGLWKGAWPLTARGALFTSGQMLGYDGFKTMAKSQGYADDVSLHVAASISASLGAGGLAAPADLVMSRYMSSTTRTNVQDVILLILKQDGIAGFWRGLPINVARLTPVMLTYSTLYEQLRYRLGLGYLS